MDKNQLRVLIKGAAFPQAGVNFADANSALQNALIEFVGEGASIRDIRDRQPEVFTLIDEMLDEMIPKALEPMIGTFAEIRRFKRDETVKFTIKNIGKNRIAYGIQPGSRGGVYKARRLDSRELMIPTKVQTVAYLVTLEDLILGKSTIADLVTLISDGFVNILFYEVVSTMRALYAAVPANNKAEGNGVIQEGLDKVIRTVSAYGSPVIMTFLSTAQKISNSAPVAWGTPNANTADLDDIRSKGYVTVYKGKGIIVIPNSFVDETNSQWIFKENDIFVLPANEKPVKVAFYGETITTSTTTAAGAMEYHTHRMLGVTVLFYNQVGMYRDTGGDSSGLY